MINRQNLIKQNYYALAKAILGKEDLKNESLK